MTNDDIDNENTPPEGDRIPTDRRPLGFWLRVVDSRLTAEFAEAFAAEGVSRRDWMLLNALSGDTEFGGLRDMLAQRMTRGARKGGKRLDGLVERGWITRTDSGWELTDEGRSAKDRLGGIVDDLRARVSGAVSPEDFATTMASLEAIARELGWDETQRMPRPGFGPRGRWGAPARPFAGRPGFGDLGRDEFGPNRHRGFRGHGHPGHGDHGHGDHDHPGARHADHGHGHGRRRAERAYERGFEAGFGAAQRGFGQRDATQRGTAPDAAA